MKPAHAYDELVRSLPLGSVRALLSILRYRIGIENAVSKRELINALTALGYFREVAESTAERQVREGVAVLRETGVPVCSSSGEGGYYLPGTWAELDTFLRAEIDSRVETLTQRRRHIVESAETYLGRRRAEDMQRGLW